MAAHRVLLRSAPVLVTDGEKSCCRTARDHNIEIVEQGRGAPDEQEHDLRAAIDARLESLLPVLLAYARRQLALVGWSDTSNRENGDASAMSLVNQALEACWAGDRHWKGTATLEQVLFGAIRSRLSSERKSSVRRRVDGAVEVDALHGEHELQQGAEEDSPLVTAAYRCADGDDDLTEYLLTVLSDDIEPNRRNMAARLNWTAERVSVARKKLGRRLRETPQAAHLKLRSP